MNKLDKEYTDLLQEILDKGIIKDDRTGTGTKSVFGKQLRHNMADGFPLLTTKKMPFKSIVTELLWFLNGDTNIKYLVDNGCNIWNGDTYKNYCSIIDKENALIDDALMVYSTKNGVVPIPSKKIKDIEKEFITKIRINSNFSDKWGELGPIYGKQWRNWSYYRKGLKHEDTDWDFHTECGEGELDNIGEFRILDQISKLINDLKTNPDSRRLLVNAWNVGELDKMILPPCHFGFQIYTKELTLDERANLHPTSDMFYNIHGSTSINDSIESSNMSEDDKLWLHEKFDEGGIPARTISLMWNQRSVDTFLGLPFNIASYGLLLTILGKIVNMVPDELICNLGDTHLYLNHLDQAKEQIGEGGIMQYEYHEDCSAAIPVGFSKKTREPFPLPTIDINTTNWVTMDDSFNFDKFMLTVKREDFKIKDYKYHPTISAPLSN